MSSFSGCFFIEIYFRNTSVVSLSLWNDLQWSSSRK
jgi:hypothetical protein